MTWGEISENFYKINWNNKSLEEERNKPIHYSSTSKEKYTDSLFKKQSKKQSTTDSAFKSPFK